MSILVDLPAGELHDAEVPQSERDDAAQLPAPVRQTLDKVFVRADVPLLVWVFR
ncbi:MAG TPA: hypothetical protein VFE86_09720 [Ilumatobacteraceae bacterium]|jgi:hypothetical protein|nr:hypothetical protein [Ilumatobacteraceae bacterium]